MNIKDLYQIFLQYPQISTDTRQIKPDSIFFALKGDNFDANLFAAEALNKGSIYAVVDNPAIATNHQFIVVNNVLETLQLLASYHRQQLAIPILAITGTNGKTTTKELVARVLAKKYNIGVTIGNLNNHIGVPLTLLSMTKETNFGVVEMGANHVGEIEKLCQIANPNYGVITNVGKAHLEGFGSLDGVKKTKGELYDHLQQTNGLAFVNTDDATLVEMIDKRKNIQTIAYSASLYNAQLLPSNNQNPFLNIELFNNVHIQTSLLGAYNLNNVLAAIAIGKKMGIDDVDIINAINSYQPNNNRSQLIHTKNNTVYMDAYNANPSSMEVSIQNFSKLNASDKLLILGDMLELGNDTLTEHQQVINQIKNEKFNKVWLVGKHFAQAAENNNQFTYFDNVDEVINFIQNNLVIGYTILIKGSRGIRLEKITDFL